jgi:phospholipid N-methyltransferase
MFRMILMGSLARKAAYTTSARTRQWIESSGHRVIEEGSTTGILTRAILQWLNFSIIK